MDKWVRTKSDEVAVDQGCWFDIKAADRVRYFFERFLRHSKGEWAGKPFQLLDWQWEHFVAPVFGWKTAEGLRRFRWAGLAVPRKRQVSTLLSGVGLYLTIGDGEGGAEVYSAAADRAQASIIYNESANMVEASDALAKRLEVIRSAKMIRDPRSNSLYKALSADAYTKEGLNIHGLLFDELHAQKNAVLFNALKYGGIARKQPLFIWITTAGTDLQSLCYQQWTKARSIQQGRTIDTRFFPYICEAEEGDDWTKEETWRKANPSFGETLSGVDFADDCKDAQSTPANENTFKRYRLNLWTKQVTRWIAMTKWDLCAASFTQDNQKRQRCTIGLDLATTTDLAAAVAVFKEGLKIRLLPYFWIPEGALEGREAENRMRLGDWVDAGYIKVTPGDVIDYDIIRSDLNALADIFKVEQLAIDPWNATQIATDLQGDGFDIEYVRTGFISISAATKEFEKLVLGKTLEHPAHPVLDWCMQNVAIETDASGNIKPSKAKSSEKIDGIVAAILGLALVIKKLAKKKSKYSNHGLNGL